jgi:hypothetical protein
MSDEKQESILDAVLFVVTPRRILVVLGLYVLLQLVLVWGGCVSQFMHSGDVPKTIEINVPSGPPQ